MLTLISHMVPQTQQEWSLSTDPEVSSEYCHGCNPQKQIEQNFPEPCLWSLSQAWVEMRGRTIVAHSDQPFLGLPILITCFTFSSLSHFLPRSQPQISPHVKPSPALWEWGFKPILIFELSLDFCFSCYTWWCLWVAPGSAERLWMSLYLQASHMQSMWFHPLSHPSGPYIHITLYNISNYNATWGQKPSVSHLFFFSSLKGRTQPGMSPMLEHQGQMH